MDRSIAPIDLQPDYGVDRTNQRLTVESSCVSSHEAATNKNLGGCEQVRLQNADFDVLLRVEHWKPAEAQLCKEIAAYYQQGKRTIQKWFVDLREIAPWFSDAELRLSDDRYTPLAVELLGYRYFAGSKKRWAAELNVQYADRLEAWKKAQLAPYNQAIPQAVIPETLPAEQVDLDGLTEALRARLRSTGQLVQQQEQGDLQKLNQHLLLAMAQGNTERLTELHQYFQEQQQQRQTADAQRLQQLQQQGEDQAITEFLVTQQAKKAMLNRLEALDSLGNAIPHPAVAADG